MSAHDSSRSPAPTMTRRVPTRRRPSASRPRLEALEVRCLLSFSPASIYPLGLSPSATVAADFNNDGRIDLAAANKGERTVSVLLGNGNGAFQAARTSGTGSNPEAVLAGDLNRDGRIDLVTVNTGVLSVLLGNGDGNFQPPRSVALPAQTPPGYTGVPLAQSPRSAVVCDLNADGRLDLVAEGYTLYFVEVDFDSDTQSPIYEAHIDDYVSVLLGNGDGTFGTGTVYHFDRSVAGNSMAVGDFDGNGKLDVVIGGPSLSTFLGNGDGTLQPPRFSADFGYFPVQSPLVDFDRDGKLDLLMGGGSVFLGNGDGTFRRTDPVLVSNIHAATAGDVNADGKPDLVLLSSNYTDEYQVNWASSASVLLGRGDGTFAPLIISNLATPPATYFTSAVLADFNGDGSPDLAGSTSASGYDENGYSYDVQGSLAVSINDGKWVIPPPPPPPPPSIAIGDVTIAEGNSGTRAASFLVTLSRPSDRPVTVTFATASGGATSGVDYQATSGTLTIPAGQTIGTITVIVKGDRLTEANEDFVINLSGATNATIADGQGNATILDDEPRFYIGDVTKSEGNSGLTAFAFTVRLSAAYDAPVTVAYSTASGSATAGVDYQAASGTLTIPAGQTIGTITVMVKGDRLTEANETFFVNLGRVNYGVVAEGLGVGTIVDDEPRISIGDVSKAEGTKGQTTLFTFTITLSAAYDQAVSMSFLTANGTATTGDQDYIARTGTLTFNPGEMSKTITVEVKGDSKKESNETLYLDLFGNSVNSLFTKKRGIGTIRNDD
jgi:hypothetical protein